MVQIRSKLLLTTYIRRLKKVVPIKVSYQLAKWVVSRDGILFILITGLLVNLVSNYLQDVMQKQRYLEMLELEIRTQILTTTNIADQFIKNQGIINTENLLDDEVYKSGLSNGYVLSIEPHILGKLTSYYHVVPGYNILLTRYYSAIDSSQAEYEKCVMSLGVGAPKNCKEIKAVADETKKFYSSLIFQTWENVYTNSIKELSRIFNPTSNRRSNFVLRFLMGNESLEFLK